MTRAGIGWLVLMLMFATLPVEASGAVTKPMKWSQIASTLAPGVDPTSPNPCNRGSTACVDAVLDEMRRRYRPLAKRCDHNVMFMYSYLVTTRQLRRSWPRDFGEPAFIGNLDGVFAHYYFAAYDAWRTGSGEVPPVWRIAFDAARSKAVTGLGDILLGINAHVSRDLPFVLASIGLAHPDGSSRFDDFSRANHVIVEAQGAMLDGAASRFDPDVADVSVPGLAVDETAFLALIGAWRTDAWVRARQLVNAGTAAERDAVTAQIEMIARARALSIAAATSYLPVISSTRSRDAFCRSRA